MPKGGTWGGAAEGSNPVGASVTGQAITASPGWAAPAGFAARASSTAVRSEATRPFMGASPGSAHVFVVVLERHVDERLPAVDLLAHRPRQRAHPEHHAAVVVVEPLAQRLRHPRPLVRVELARDRVDVLAVRPVAQDVDGTLRVCAA